MKANPNHEKAVNAVQWDFNILIAEGAHTHATNYNQFENDSKAVEQHLIPFGQTHAHSMELPSDALRFDSLLFSLCIY